ncbi:MAG: putative lipoprotein YmbA [Gammaproteobacteria bacterium]
MTWIRLYALILVLAGCTSAPTEIRYYLLSSDLPNVTRQEEFGSNTHIAVGPIIVPDYLDQPLIVTVNDGGTLNLSENDRWASPLSHGIQALLISRLTDRLSGARVAAFPSTQGFIHKVRVAVEILRLDGSLGDLVTLHARFQVLDSVSGLTVYEQDVHLKEPVAGVATAQLVAAQRTATLALADAVINYFDSLASDPD